MEHFDLMHTPTLESPFWQGVDDVVNNGLYFLFRGKAYALFSLLFGLSFFMQCDSQAKKGKDFRLRFVWRMVILFAFGFVNGLVYMGEFFVIYATLGLILVPLYKVSTRWLIAICAILFLQIPQLWDFISLVAGNAPNEPTPLVVMMNEGFDRSAEVFANGSLWEVLKFNAQHGQFTKILWFINEYRYVQLAGLFIAGVLIGRSGVHKDEAKMEKYSQKLLPWAFGWFAVFYGSAWLLPTLGLEGFALESGVALLKNYGNLGMLMIYVCGLTMLYYNTKSGRRALDTIAPVGRMSVTNYMAQSMMGVVVFYGFGLNLAMTSSYLESALAGVAIAGIQILYSNWWMKRYYYGPMEWLWRRLTWFTKVPFKRV